MKIVSSAKISEKHQQKLRNIYPNIAFDFFDNIKEAENSLVTTDILVTYGEDLTTELIEKSQYLKWIQVISAGIDKLPFAAIKEKNLMVTNAKGIHYIPMAEYTFSVILQVARKTNLLHENQIKSYWDRTVRVSEIQDTTLGVIGIGSIGKGIVDIAKAFHMKVVGMNTDGRPVPNVDQVFKPDEMKELLAISDYIVVIVPLTEKTYHLIDKDAFEGMRESAYIINIARGEVIDELALIDALKTKKIAGAVLDVFSTEPLPENHPFWTLDNCIVTPHLSGRSPKYMNRALDIFIENLDKYLNKEYTRMKNLIDVKKGY